MSCIPQLILFVWLPSLQMFIPTALEHAVKPLFPREAAKITFSPHAARAPAGIVILFAEWV